MIKIYTYIILWLSQNNKRFIQKFTIIFQKNSDTQFILLYFSAFDPKYSPSWFFPGSKLRANIIHFQFGYNLATFYCRPTINYNMAPFYIFIGHVMFIYGSRYSYFAEQWNYNASNAYRLKDHWFHSMLFFIYDWLCINWWMHLSVDRLYSKYIRLVLITIPIKTNIFRFRAFVSISIRLRKRKRKTEKPNDSSQKSIKEICIRNVATSIVHGCVFSSRTFQ